jgi:uncharacterized Zn-binding protein involved in type VI secretion
MGIGLARVGDTCSGYCDSHHSSQTGTVTTGSGDVNANGAGIAFQGSIVTAGCGHTGVVQATSTTVTANGKAVARIGDTFTGTFHGTITGGSSNVKAG